MIIENKLTVYQDKSKNKFNNVQLCLYIYRKNDLINNSCAYVINNNC